MNLTSNDRRLLQKYRDGEMTESEAAGFRARVEAEPALRRGLTELDELSRGFAAGRERVFASPAGFTASLLAEVRQLPDRIQMQQAEISGAALVLCRRVLIAAAILFGIGLCWQAGLFPDGRSDRLEAAPTEVEREMERLDEIVRSWGR